MTDFNQDDEEYYVPLVDQRVFGAGLKRKRVAFVPAVSNESVSHATTPSSVASRYLSIVMQKKQNLDTDKANQQSVDTVEQIQNSQNCLVCNQPLSSTDSKETTHDTSIAHQICEKHSHPPSHLDRSRRGLQYLQDYGWDPDARQGLGAHQEGIRIPIKAREKNDSTGLGFLTVDEEEPTRSKKRTDMQKTKVDKLNAKEIRRIEEEKGQRAEKLRQAIYSEDLSQYLGSNG